MSASHVQQISELLLRRLFFGALLFLKLFTGLFHGQRVLVLVNLEIFIADAVDEFDDGLQGRQVILVLTG